MSELEIRRAINAADVAQQAADYILAELYHLQKLQPVSHLALTGGSVGILTLTHMAQSDQLNLVDFSKVQVWFGDERFVASDSPDRNAVQARQALLDQLDIPQENIHEFPASESNLTPIQAAKMFENYLFQTFAGAPIAMDLMILGMGPDGHVASLFPGKTQAEGLIVAEERSPKPPPKRLSMSMQMINQSKKVVFVVSGIDKAEVIEQVHNNPDCQLPAAMVQGKIETLWIVDEAAGAAFWSC